MAAPSLPAVQERTGPALERVQGTPEWVEARRATIGSSDIPVITGESPHKSALELWAEKTGLVEPTVDPETADLLETGKLIQPVLLRLYERKSGRHAKGVFRTHVHPDLPWAIASLDGTAPVRRIVEAKWTHSARWNLARDRIPDDVEQQVQWQMFVVGWDVADVVVLHGPQTRVIEIARDQRYIEDLVAIAERFHDQVAMRTQPALDGSESTRRTLTALHPRDREPLMAADQAWDNLARDLAVARAAAKDAAATEATIENAIRALLGDAAGVEGKGWHITWKKNADSTRVGWEQVSLAYRLLLEAVLDGSRKPSELRLEDLDSALSMFTTTREGPRVLRAGGGLFA